MSEIREPCNGTVQPPANNHAVETAYDRWAALYDTFYRTWLEPGRRAGAVAASQLAGPILDVGVGTGLELPMFRPDTRVFGVDLSEPMLRLALRRIRRERLRHVEGLACMDATRLAFPDASFACALMLYVLTVTPEPKELDWAGAGA